MTSSHEALRAALKPFAEFWKALNSEYPDHEENIITASAGIDGQEVFLTFGDYRRAAEAYAALEASQPMLSGGDGMVRHETLAPIKAWAIVLDGKSYDVDPPRRICPDQINPRNIYAQELGAKQAGNGREVVQVLITPLSPAPASDGETEADDPPCTDCGGTGITYQTERRCACQGKEP